MDIRFVIESNGFGLYRVKVVINGCDFVSNKTFVTQKDAMEFIEFFKSKLF